MALKHKAILAAIVAALIIGLVRYCDRDRIIPTEPGVLAPNEKERIEIRGKTVTVIRADKTIKSFAPGGAKIRVRKDGSVDVEIKRLGFSREPGLGVAYNGDKLKLAIDVKVAYYRRLGFHVGATYDPVERRTLNVVKPLAFVSYTMPSDNFANTSIWLGTELLPQRISGGLRLAF